jgi:hypothetical protein
MKYSWLPAFGLLLLSASALAETDDEFLKRAQWDISHTSNNPAAVQFRNLRIGQYRNSRGRLIPSVCGEVNSKNLFGGYAGFQKFWYMDRETLSIQDSRERGPIPWNETAGKVCDSK